MRIFLDCSARKIKEWTLRFNHPFGQLITPLTRYKRCEGVDYGLDNGCFTHFNEGVWRQLVNEAEYDHPKFITAPDVVGSAVRTLDLFDHYHRELCGLPACLVLQDGIGNHRIPWDKVSAVFVGGSDAFKTSQEAIDACKVARFLGKWVHVGRVNSFQRAEFWRDLADSCDGSGVSQYDAQVKSVLAGISHDERQPVLFGKQ